VIGDRKQGEEILVNLSNVAHNITDLRLSHAQKGMLVDGILPTIAKAATCRTKPTGAMGELLDIIEQQIDLTS